MNCSDVERILPEVMDTSVETSAESAAGSAGASANDVEVQAHLKSCPACAALIADLRMIANEANMLAESEEPPERVWVKISNQLRAEGLIHDPEVAHPAGPVLVPSPSPRRKTLWWMVPVAAAILAVGSYQLIHHSTPNNAQIAKVQTPATVAQSAQSPPISQPSSDQATQPTAGISPTEAPVVSQSNIPPAANSQATQNQATQDQDNDNQLAQNSTQHNNAQNQARQRDISPSNVDDQRFLSEVSTRAPSMRSTYENQLRAVNNEILETQAYIQQHPNDLDARQHLLDVFQQKSLLYQLALDRIQ